MEKPRGIKITNIDKQKQCDIHVVSASFPKRSNHDHFWIEDGFLYESYTTIRGLRYAQIMAVGNMPDVDKCSEICMTYIAKEYLH